MSNLEDREKKRETRLISMTGWIDCIINVSGISYKQFRGDPSFEHDFNGNGLLLLR